MDAEHQTLKQLLETDLADQAGCFAIIAGDRLVGVFKDYNEALVAGYATCGFSPFLLARMPSIPDISARRVA
jgi:hypothetical protein